MIKYLEDEGLNLFAVIDLVDLTAEVKSKMSECYRELDSYSQLLLCGHGGNRFWQRLTEAKIDGKNPVDDRSVQVITAGLEKYAAGADYKILYPGISSLPLQGLGCLSGWHHHSPLGLGIHPTYGLWFAYRSVVLSNTSFDPTTPLTSPSPCLSCEEKTCVTACPAAALSNDRFDVSKCVSYRLSEQSNCTSKCIARIACPVAPRHRYADEQLNYHYSHSLATIKRFYSS